MWRDAEEIPPGFRKQESSMNSADVYTSSMRERVDPVADGRCSLREQNVCTDCIVVGKDQTI